MEKTKLLVILVTTAAIAAAATAIMSSAIPAHAVEQCSTRGSLFVCTGGSGNGGVGSTGGGHSVTNLNTGEFTTSGGGNNGLPGSGGGGSGGHTTFKNGQFSCAGNICP